LERTGRGSVFVIGEGCNEFRGVEEPAKDNLGFGGGAFGNEFGVGQDVAPNNGFLVPCMRPACEVHDKGSCMQAPFAIFGGAKKGGNEVINVAIGVAGAGHRDGDSQGLSWGKWNVVSKEGRFGGDGLSGAS
jgi:hypothetical protein